MNASHVSRAQAWSLADQALVSGTNFLGSVILARVLGLEAFGAYVVAQMYLLYANTFQGALVVSPMMIAIPASVGTVDARRRLVNGYLAYAAMVCVATVVVVQLLAEMLGRWSSALAVGELALPLAALMLAFQTQDWQRRVLYARSAHRRVFFSDLFAYGGYLGVILLLAASEKLDASAAFWAMACTFGLTAACELVLNRHRPDFGAAIAVIGEQWRNSRDYLLSWQLQWVASQGVILFGTAVAGQQAAGAIRAAQNLLGPVMVLFQWLDNVLPVRFARHARDAGADALRLHAARLRNLGLAALSLVTVALTVLGEPLMTAVYGEPYRPFATLVWALAIYFLFGYAYRMDSYQARALGQTALLARASAIWAAVSIFVAVALAVGGRLSALGIVAAMIAGEIAAAACLLLERRAHGSATAGGCGRASEAVFVLLGGRGGRARLVLPAGSGRHLRAALQMYAASRWTGRLYRFVLGALLPIAARLRLIPRRTAAQAGIPDLSSMLALVPDAKPCHVGGLISEELPGAWKLTLRFMDAQGGALAYARAGRHPEVLARLAAEGMVLDRLAESSVAGQVPTIIARGELDVEGASFLIETAGPDRTGGLDLEEAHFRFLAGLRVAGTVSLADVTKRLASELGPFLQSRHPARAAVSAALARLSARGSAHLALCIEHGDFAPWNIKRCENGGLFVIDWEHAQPEGLPWCDALHFCFQTGVLARRWSAEKVLRAMRGMMGSESAVRYGRPMSLRGEALGADEFIDLYLLRATARNATNDNPGASCADCRRLEVLGLLARAEEGVGGQGAAQTSAARFAADDAAGREVRVLET